MTDIAPVINYILPRDRDIDVLVSDLKPAGKLFPSNKSKNPDGQIRCHMFMAQYSEFPNPVPVQWCNSNPGVTEFKNGDRIKILGGNYNNDALIQSVTWKGTLAKETQQQPMKAVVNNSTAPGVVQKGERRVLDNPNPQVMGSLWSICMGHAINFYKDRKDGTEKKVLAFAQALHDDYEKVIL